MSGLYLSAEEYTSVRDILYGKKPARELPCRVASTAAYFARPDVVGLEEEHILCRTSFKFHRVNMSEMLTRYKARKPPHHDASKGPITHSLEFLLEEADIRDELFILDNCFKIDFCDKHECCNVLFQGTARPLRFSCCDLKECTWYCNF